MLWWELTFTCPFVIAGHFHFLAAIFRHAAVLTVALFFLFLSKDLSIRLARDSPRCAANHLDMSRDGEAGKEPEYDVHNASADNGPSKAFQHEIPGIQYQQYSLAKEAEFLPQIRELISKDLSEPYSIYVYRYFLYQWAELCFVALDEDDDNKLVGVVICKLERHRGGPLRGYIAMLATKESHRGKGIAITLVSKAIDLMIEKDADEIALETEETNTAAMALYEKLGFLRSKKLHRYYLNGNSAYRLLLYLKEGVGSISPGYDPYGDMPPSAADWDRSDGDDPFYHGIV
jgi:N-alpha-acetyltransferase 30